VLGEVGGGGGLEAARIVAEESAFESLILVTGHSA